MGTSSNLGLRDLWVRLLTKLPLPVSMLFAAWMLLSLAFSLGQPSSTANLSPTIRYIVLLPIGAVSFGLSIFIIWNGGLTLFRALKSIVQDVPEREMRRRPTFNLIGGIGALHIYMVVYFLIAFGSAKQFGGYAVGIFFSCIMCAGLAFVLFKRSPHPKDVKIFLWGSLIVTAIFGIIMATVAVPPA